MNDFLDNLVTRTLNVGEMVQPRPWSLFEPSASPDWVWPETLAAEVVKGEPVSNNAPHASHTSPPPESKSPFGVAPPAVEQQQLAAVTPPKRCVEPAPATGQDQPGRDAESADSALAVHPPQPPLQPSAPEMRPAMPQLAPPAQAVAQPMPRHLLLSTAPLPESAASHPPATAVTPPDAAPPSSPAVTDDRPARVERETVLQPLIEPTIVEHITPPSPLPDSTARLAPPSPDTSSGEVTQMVDRRKAIHEPLTPLDRITRVIAPSAQAVVQPRITPYVEPVPVSVGPAPAPAPTIHVTIGRVEVRATPPPPTLRKQRRSEPAVMSLDEYLRRRADGGHR